MGSRGRLGRHQNPRAGRHPVRSRTLHPASCRLGQAAPSNPRATLASDSWGTFPPRYSQPGRGLSREGTPSTGRPYLRALAPRCSSTMRTPNRFSVLMGEHSGQRGLRRSQPLPPLPTAWPGECPQALGELAGSATTNHRSEAARRASPLRGWTLRCSSETSSRLWRLGRLPTPLDEALQRVEEQLADHALLSRAPDVEALCEQARVVWISSTRRAGVGCCRT